MAKKNTMLDSFFENLSLYITKFTGSTTAFISALLLIIIWFASGPIFDFSEVWQLIINTTTTIITFLMVFIIQRSQNKDSLAIQLKLNELIASMEGASNRLVDIEDISEKDMETLKKHYQKLAVLFEKEKNLKESHSVEEAQKRHTKKIKQK
jgi:low affinity Fe/Cu permease